MTRASVNVMTPDTRVLIRTGAHGGREGVVTSEHRSISGRTVINVRLVAPVLILDPDGPTHEVVLPYAPAELEVLG